MPILKEREPTVAFRFNHLDRVTRIFMLAEVERDIDHGTLYLSPRLTDRGRIEWPKLLREAVGSSDEQTFAKSLMSKGLLRDVEQRRSSRGWGRVQMVRVPRTAAWT